MARARSLTIGLVSVLTLAATLALSSRAEQTLDRADVMALLKDLGLVENTWIFSALFTPGSATGRSFPDASTVAPAFPLRRHANRRQAPN